MHKDNINPPNLMDLKVMEAEIDKEDSVNLIQPPIDSKKLIRNVDKIRLGKKAVKITNRNYWFKIKLFFIRLFYIFKN